MSRPPREPLFTEEDVMHILFPLTCALVALAAVRITAGPNAGVELMVGLLVAQAFFIELRYFREINRFERERHEPELWF